MKYLFLLIMSLLSFYIQAHDFNMTVFNISRENNEVLLTIRIDKEDLMEKVLNSNAVDPYAQEKIISYLEKNFQTILNARNVSWTYHKVKYEKDIIEIEASIKEINEDIKSLELKNTALINQIPDHKSLIHFNLHDKKRSFKMDRNRTTINVSY